MTNLTKIGLGAGLAYLAWRAWPRPDPFRNQTVLITGGSRGLGLVLARDLARRGARIGLLARDAGELARAADELRPQTQVVTVAGDVGNARDCERFVAEARGRLGPVGVLIHNAGIIGVGPMEVMERADYERALATHLWGAVNMAEAVLPEMRRHRAGRIINIASFGGKVAVPHMLPYVASKFALVGYSTGLRAEVAKDGIVVTTVSPGLLRTGSHLNAEFKGQHRAEYTWFAMGNGLPGLSMSAETAARRILAASARGDAELVLGLPAKVAVVVQGLAPNLMAAVSACVNRYVLPAPGGVGPRRVPGRESRTRLADAFSPLSDRAATANNELAPALPTIS